MYICSTPLSMDVDWAFDRSLLEQISFEQQVIRKRPSNPSKSANALRERWYRVLRHRFKWLARMTVSNNWLDYLGCVSLNNIQNIPNIQNIQNIQNVQKYTNYKYCHKNQHKALIILILENLKIWIFEILENLDLGEMHFCIFGVFCTFGVLCIINCYFECVYRIRCHFLYI